MQYGYNIKKSLKIFVCVIAVLIIVGYAVFRTKDLVGGPKIIITEPQNGITVQDSLVKISGTTENISAISLNDRPIFVDEKGVFQENLLLSYGYNIMKIEATDRFGRKTSKILEIVYK